MFMRVSSHSAVAQVLRDQDVEMEDTKKDAYDFNEYF